MIRFLSIGLLLILYSTAEGRVFNFAGVDISSYLRASGGTAYFGNDAFKNSGGNQDVFSGAGAEYAFAGEIGFSFDMNSVTTRVGFEFFRPQHLSNYEIQNSGGTVLYALDSDIISYSPVITFEIPFSKTQNFKSYMFFGGGYGYVNLKNMYTFTASGTSTYGKADFVEDAKTQTIFGIGGMGFEKLMVDNVTFSMELGYRYMESGNFKLKGAVDSFVGSKVEGDLLMNYYGARSINLSQPFLAILFKFYI